MVKHYQNTLYEKLLSIKINKEIQTEYCYRNKYISALSLKISIQFGGSSQCCSNVYLFRAEGLVLHNHFRVLPSREDQFPLPPSSYYQLMSLHLRVGPHEIFPIHIGLSTDEQLTMGCLASTDTSTIQLLQPRLKGCCGRVNGKIANTRGPGILLQDDCLLCMVWKLSP